MRSAALIVTIFLLWTLARTAFAADSTSPVEVYVWGEQPTSAATEQTRWQKDLELRPSNTPSDVMRLTPGLTIGQHHGGGKSDQILFRGFDSDHGTDFAVFVDGIPVNMVSHGHGQGYADLESELVFVGDEGTFEPAGASRRHGIESEFRYEIFPWLSYDLDLSYTWAKFLNSDKVPLAPRLTVSSGITIRHESGIQARLQMRHIGRRYSIEDSSILTPTSTIFDLFLKYVWKRYEFFIELQNLANTNWRAAEHAFESRIPSEVAGGLPGRLDSHFTPGDPFTAKAGVAIHLW